MRTIWFILAVLIWAIPAAAQSRNAADLYRLAARDVPRADSDAERHVWVDVLDAPLDAVSQSILQRAESALESFDAASLITFGNWGFNELNPPYAGQIIPNLPELTRLVSLRARQRSAAAIDDCFNLILLSRRLSIQPSLARQKQQTAVLIQAVDTTGTMLLDIPVAELRRLTDRFGTLRAPTDPLEVAVVEKRSYMFVHRKLVDDATIRRLTSFSQEKLNEIFGIDVEAVDVFDLVLDPEKGRRVFAETDLAFEEMMIALKKPLDQQQRENALRQVMAKYEGSHALVQGAVKIVYESHRQSEIQTALLDMLKVAVAISMDRPVNHEAARLQAQLYGYAPTSSGFELSWTLASDGTRLTLRVGSRPVRHLPATRGAIR